MAPRTERPRTPLIWTLLKILLALVLAGFVLSKTDIGELLALRGRIIPGWLGAAFLLFISLTLLKALQYYFLIGRRVSYLQVLHIVIVQNAVSNFIATSAGIASYLTLFQLDQGVKLSRSALAFILAKVGDLIAIWLLLILGSASVWSQIRPIHLVVELLIIGIGAVLLGFFLLVILRQKFVAALRRFLAWLKLERFGLVSRGLNTLDVLAESRQSFIFRTMSTALLISMIYMGITMAWLYASLRTFSLEIGVMPTVFANTLLQLVSYLPVQIFGGLGLTETSMLFFYSFFDLPQGEFAAVLIGTRLLFYLENLLVLLYLPLQSLVLARFPQDAGRQ
jgi:uncharacterized membrane protein YbhN (UPF0104 family)